MNDFGAPGCIALRESLKIRFAFIIGPPDILLHEYYLPATKCGLLANYKMDEVVTVIFRLLYKYSDRLWAENSSHPFGILHHICCERRI